MYADKYGVFTPPFGYCSMVSPSAKLPAREVLSAAILRNYTQVGGTARRAPLGFAPNRRRPDSPGGHFRRRDDSRRSTEGGTGRPWWFTDGVGEGDSGRIHSNHPPYMACADIRRFFDPRILRWANFRTEVLHPTNYPTKLATNLQKTHNPHGKVRKAPDS